MNTRLRKTWMLLVVILACLPSGAAAHPLDEFYQVTFITLGPTEVIFRIQLYPGIFVAPTISALLDTNQDMQISAAETQAYITAFKADLAVALDGTTLDLEVLEVSVPAMLDLQAGTGVVAMTLRSDIAPGDGEGHQLHFENNHLPEISTYLVDAISQDVQYLQITDQAKDVFQKEVQVTFAVAEDTPALPAAEPSPEVTGVGQSWLTPYLYDSQLSPWLVVLMLGVAIILGGLHALTPGHGKTLVAAYLIGSRGTVGDAMFLGGIVTFTHTASVIIIGLIALLASHYIVPNLLAPILEIVSGLLVVVLGCQLIWSRWAEYRQRGLPHEAHSHEQSEHHHHTPEQVHLGSLLALGVSGGIVPCPEALGIMVIAIGLNRIALGLGLVVAFSLGLALVLISIGVLLVRAKSVLDKGEKLGQRWQSLLPLLSAVLVTLLGVAITLRGLWPYLVD